MSDSTESTSPSITAASLLGIVFITLKLTHVISWSWWWVTLPFWGIAAVVAAVIIFVVFGLCLGMIAKTLFKL